MDLFESVVRGPTIPGPASFKSWYEIPSEPVDSLLGSDFRKFPTSLADSSVKWN